MKFYLSSFKVGNETEKLKKLVPKGKILGLIPNALDWRGIEERRQKTDQNIKDLTDLGIKVEILDLQYYFEKKDKLKKKTRRASRVI